ncbi:CrcB family protein [Halorubrum sp. AD140]|uniref:fluoride efflux transporter FluC n=1 Tax=Halorubrum sp. AD140 TaxID=3050073 RepID=UPI002ACCB67E|nr:CrcB family protein [Halorubrum sp. AD140]MDZ5812127.1 CrcB family protein [Halorubrum sp. AD140]
MTDPLLATALVGVGGSLGAALRHAVGLRVAGRRSVVAVNALGSLALGGVLAAPVAPETALLLGAGFCGAFTTFSSFAVETVATARDGELDAAIGFAAANLLAAVVAFLVGSALAGTLA